MELMPLKLHPCYKEYLWGGHRLRTDYHKSDAPDVTAESWELAQRPEGVSAVEGGALAGETLEQLADVTGIHQTNISKLESGTANPSLRTLKRLAAGMGMRLKLEFVPVQPKNRTR